MLPVSEMRNVTLFQRSVTYLGRDSRKSILVKFIAARVGVFQRMCLQSGKTCGGLRFASIRPTASAHAVKAGTPGTGYLGAAIGYGSTTVEADFSEFDFSSSLEEDGGGVAGSFFAGYSGVYGRLFGAIEGQGLLNAADQSRSANNTGITFEQRQTLGLLGKVGFLPIPKLLVYGAFGWAWTNFEAIAIDVSDSISDDDWFNGPRAGIGIEYAATDNLFARLEYTHTWYESNTYTDGIATLDLEGDESLFLIGAGYPLLTLSDIGVQSLPRLPAAPRQA